eukprot:CAMPEP_0172361208 /NCGR_PEP_ID=MMETSP1060-20121228/5074_1 /TAXON_ID=37318 /ORGANISM="Pseudo-nitzschia pungens, Strain cf. cingulata" /LENGTH=609 /DNA_ID=CAMNT_0013083397 /DNA_START=82 /DNA_END=1911 /DNA_ORIENTATION=+
MPKNKKNKRPKIKDVSEFSGLANLTGFGGSGDAASMDDCMAEMMFQGENLPQQKDSSRDGPSSANANANANATTAKSDSFPKPETTHPTKREKHRQPSWIQQANKTKTSSKHMMSTEDVENWERSFRVWAKGGIYTPGLLPNIDQEIARNFKVKELSDLLLKNKQVAGKDLRMPVFERWLLDSKHEEEAQVTGGDSVLPLQSSPDSEASQRLLSELTSKQNDIDESDAEKIIAKLCRSTNLACQELLSQEDRFRRQSPLNKGDRINTSTKSSTTNNLVSIEYSRKRWKKPFCFRINKIHYEKLKNRFLDIHPNLTFGENKTAKNNTETMLERSFHILILALLLRYSALSGGGLLDDLRGGGMQGAIHSSVFDVLKTHFSNTGETSSSNAWFEGFASPFNATLPRFASAFPDLDWHFGSVGRFFDCRFDAEAQPDENDSGGEYCEANPPFTPGIMLSMADHMIETLERADEKNLRLTFVVVVPSANNSNSKNNNNNKKKKRSTKESQPSDLNDNIAVAKSAAAESFRAMISSSYCTKHIVLNAREHGYVEGAQHLRPTQYKQSSYDTSVIILQTPNANSTDFEQLEKEIRLAFSSRHESELIERKRKIGT